MNLDKKFISQNWQPLEHLEKIEYLASLGLDEGQIAAQFNIPSTTLRYWRVEEPKVNLAIERGLSSSILIATDQLNQMIQNGDFKAIRFFLERKGGWGTTVTIRNSLTLPSVDSFNLEEISPE